MTRGRLRPAAQAGIDGDHDALAAEAAGGGLEAVARLDRGVGDGRARQVLGREAGELGALPRLDAGHQPVGVLDLVRRARQRHIGADAREPRGMEARLRVSRGPDDAPFGRCFLTSSG